MNTYILIATAVAVVMVTIAIVMLMVRDWRWQKRMDEITNRQFQRVIKELDREFADIDKDVKP
jgi:predicted membrane protein